MTDITELAQRMKAAAEKATPGEWWADEVKNEGCYGSGDDCVEGFTSYAIYGSDGQTLFDSLNSDAACICEEYDGEGHVAWDETAQRNAEFIALANPANVLALVEALEKAQQHIARQEQIILNQDESLSIRRGELEARDKQVAKDVQIKARLCRESNSLHDRLREAENRIAELEKSELQLIDERDIAEDALGDMYQAATGERPEWSSAFGISDAIDALEQRLGELESRTVKLPDFRHERFNSDWGEHDAEAYQVALREALTAAGIQVEDE